MRYKKKEQTFSLFPEVNHPYHQNLYALIANGYSRRERELIADDFDPDQASEIASYELGQGARYKIKNV